MRNGQLLIISYPAQFLYFNGNTMKILWIAQRDLFQDLNVATWLEMTKSLVKRKHDVTLIAMKTWGKKDSKRIRGAKLKEINIINCFPFITISFHLQIMILSLYWLFAFVPEVILMHPITAIFMLPAYSLAKIFKLPVKFVLDIRTLPVRSINLNDKIKAALVNISIHIGKNFFDGITTITPALQKYIAKKFRLEQQKIGIWMSGVNLELFCPQTKTTDSSPKFIVMYHGVIAENRGIIETVRAMGEVKKKLPNILFIILGKGPALKKIIAMVSQLSLNGTVQYHDAVAYHEIPDYIANADVGIIPLPDEPCWRVSSPLKMVEYLAMAKPVIVSPIEAHTSLLKHCPAAIFLESTTPEEIAAGIIKAYEMRQKFPQLGKDGRKFVMKYFSWKYQALSLEKFFTQLK